MLFMSILILLISNAVSTRRDKSILYSRVAVIILISCLLISIYSFNIKLYDKGIGLFGGLYHVTIISHIFHIFIFIVSIAIIQLNSFYPRKIINTNLDIVYKVIFIKLLNKISQQYKIIEYPLIILFIIMGGIFLISSSDLISIFLSIELQSYALYILCAIYRNSERATSGALTYFLLGGLSSCFILLGSSLIYGNSGTTGFDSLYIINNISGVGDYSTLTSFYDSNYFNFAFSIMSIGFLFKISAAPFHFWSPDVYDAIPTVVTTFVAVFAKISILILLLELVHFTNNMFVSNLEFENFSQYYTVSWTFTILISSFLSLIIGSILGLTQSRIKRLYAYSTISHIGFILLAISINTIESTQSFIFYLMQYSISNINAFLLLIAIGYVLYFYVERNNYMQTKEKISIFNYESKNRDKVYILNNDIADRNNSPIQLITDIKGFFFINPVLAMSLGITIFSFVGIPPLVGFFAKQMVLTSALANGYVFMAIIAILTSVISAYYYLVIVKQIFFEDSNYELNNESIDVNTDIDENRIDKGIYLSSNLTSIISIFTLVILLFILSPQEWLNITTIISLVIFNF